MHIFSDLPDVATVTIGDKVSIYIYYIYILNLLIITSIINICNQNWLYLVTYIIEFWQIYLLPKQWQNVITMIVD